MRSVLGVLFGALVITLVSSGLGLTVNALRARGIPIVAPFPYEQDCPDKLTIPEGPTLEATQALQLVRGGARPIFVDARPAEAFADGHLPGARSIPFSFIAPIGADRIAGLDRERALIVYCDSPGDRLAGLLAEQLRELGLREVKVLRGGLAAWRATEGAP